MKKIILPLLFLAATVIGCTKDKNIVDPGDEKTEDPSANETKISIWYIDGEMYASDKVKKQISAPEWFGLTNEGNIDNGYDSSFNISIFIGNHNINNDSFSIFGPRVSVSSPVDIAINGHQGRYAIVDSGTYLYTTTVNGKIKLTLPPTYFRKLIPDGNGALIPEDDSTIIQGVFYAP